jgi:hypothetical protein
MNEVRPEMVKLLVDGIAGSVTETEFDAVASESTDSERLAAARVLAQAAQQQITPSPLLALNFHQLNQVAALRWSEGHALGWLADQLSPTWASRPEMTLGDVLKVEHPDRVEYLALELRRVWLDLGDDR